MNCPKWRTIARMAIPLSSLSSSAAIKSRQERGRNALVTFELESVPITETTTTK